MSRQLKRFLSNLSLLGIVVIVIVLFICMVPKYDWPFDYFPIFIACTIFVVGAIGSYVEAFPPPMKVVVMQNQADDLTQIKNEVAKIGAERAAQIVFTSNPQRVMLEVIRHKRILVISGQQMPDGILLGNHLARMVKARNPNALFVIYSALEIAIDEAVDGTFPKKPGSHYLLARMLTGNLDHASVRRAITPP